MNARIAQSVVIILVLAIGGYANADTIIIDGVTYEDVYVREASEMVFVQVPDTGQIIPVGKSDVESLTIHPDETYRQSLLAQWDERRAATRAQEPILPAVQTDDTEPEIPAVGDISSDAQSDHSSPSSLRPIWIELVLNGESHWVNAQEVNLSGLLAQLAHPMDADTAVRRGRIRMVQPRSSGSRNQGLHAVTSRALNAATAGAAVPRIVVNNPGGIGTQAVGMAANPGGFSAGPGAQTGIGSTGFGQTGFGQAGFGGQGGFGQQGFGGQGGFGQGGGAGFGAGGGGVAHFSNISQLFTNIDDRLVGESPPVIGVQASFWQSLPPVPARGGWANPERTRVPGGGLGQMGGQVGQPGMAGPMGRRY